MTYDEVSYSDPVPQNGAAGAGNQYFRPAAEKNLISIDAVNIRDYTQDKHGKVDDYTYGGGAGMLMQAQPVYDAYRSVAGEKKDPLRLSDTTGSPFYPEKSKRTVRGRGTGIALRTL